QPKVLRRNIVAATPLLLEFRPLISKALGKLLDDLGDERIGLLDSATRLVDEASLNRVPARAIVVGLIRCKERGRLVPHLLPGHQRISRWEPTFRSHRIQ